MQTGIIGLGAMGTGMARNLARSGYLTSLWNRTPDKAHTLIPMDRRECALTIAH
jgi:3-hydroxyisobutyrate dehydrogenase